MLKELVEKRKELEAKSKSLEQVFTEAKTDSGELDFTRVKCLGETLTTVAKAEKVRAMNAELTALGIEIDKLAQIEQAEADQHTRKQRAGSVVQHSGDPAAHALPEPKSFGEWFLQSKAYRSYRETGVPGVHISTYELGAKTLFTNATGFPPESLRTGRIVESAQRPVQLLDVIPLETTGFAAIKYMEETTFTNLAAETAEGGLYPEATLAFTERSVTVEKLPVFLPVTDEQLEDEPRISAILDNRLMFMVRQRLDSQMLNGTGVSPQMTGILNKAGIQTQAKGTDPAPDAIRKAMTKVRVTGRALPNVVVLHPNNWQDIRLLRTVEGVYIWGSPSESGPERIWGAPVAQADSIALGTGLVGDFANFAGLVTRKGIEVQVGFVNDDFARGRKSIRVDLRAAMVWYRASAFSTVTGL